MQAVKQKKHRVVKSRDDGGVLGEYQIKSHQKGKIKYTRDEEGRVIVDQESFKKALGKPLKVHPVVKNKVVSGSTGHGRNLIIRQLTNDTTYGIAVDSAKIGTGTTAPADSDTDIETVVLSGIVVALYETNNNIATISFFIPDGDLANGTYTEFTLHIGSQLFSRSLILPTFSKSANEDTTIEYTLTLT